MPLTYVWSGKLLHGGWGCMTTESCRGRGWCKLEACIHWPEIVPRYDGWGQGLIRPYCPGKELISWLAWLVALTRKKWIRFGGRSSITLEMKPNFGCRRRSCALVVNRDADHGFFGKLLVSPRILAGEKWKKVESLVNLIFPTEAYSGAVLDSQNSSAAAVAVDSACGWNLLSPRRLGVGRPNQRRW